MQPRHQAVLSNVLACEVSAAALEKYGMAWTAIEQRSISPAHVRLRVIGSAGIFMQRQQPHRPGLAWAFLSTDLRHHMVTITRRARMMLNLCPRPVIAEIDGGFPEGVRWVRALGFEPYGEWTWIYDAHLS